MEMEFWLELKLDKHHVVNEFVNTGQPPEITERTYGGNDDKVEVSIEDAGLLVCIDKKKQTMIDHEKFGVHEHEVERVETAFFPWLSLNCLEIFKDLDSDGEKMKLRLIFGTASVYLKFYSDTVFRAFFSDVDTVLRR